MLASSLAALLAIYGAGLVRLWRTAGYGRGIRPLEAAAFGAGWLTLAIALSPPLDAWSDRWLAAHMIQHELLMVIAAPLVAVSAPMIGTVWALPTGIRHRIIDAIRRTRIAVAWGALTAPASVFVLYAIALWVWHIPVLYDAALAHENVHVVQHLCFFGTAALFWWGIAHSRHGRTGYGAAVVYVFATAVHGGLLGALMTISPRVWYAPYLATRSANFTPLEDQQLAGLLMWIPASAVFVAGALVLCAGWLRQADRLSRFTALALVCAAAGVLGASAPPLRVCADPNNMPFSNAHGDGFENRIATLVATDLHRPLVYYWLPQRRGFLRNSLDAGQCDVVISVPASYERVQTTRRYYRSSYVFVSREDRHLRIDSFDAARLRRLTIGIQISGDDYNNPPAAQALAARHLIANVRGFTLYGDYSTPDPQRDIVDAVADGRVDVAVAWGPLAGYYARREPAPMVVTPIASAGDSAALPFVFDIAMGVRRDEAALRDALNATIARRAGEIHQILRSYGVPLR